MTVRQSVASHQLNAVRLEAIADELRELSGTMDKDSRELRWVADKLNKKAKMERNRSDWADGKVLN